MNVLQEVLIDYKKFYKYNTAKSKTKILLRKQQMQEEKMSETKNPTPKKKSAKQIIITIVGIYLVYCIVINIFNNNGNTTIGKNDKEACEAAELHVQSSIYKSSGAVPVTRSKVVYKNDRYTCVAVKYTLTEEDWDNFYWARFVCIMNSINAAVRMTDDVGGLDYDNIPNDVINELKVLWELQ